VNFEVVEELSPDGLPRPTLEEHVVRHDHRRSPVDVEDGFDVLCPHKGFTASHQVLVNVSKLGGGDKVSKILEQANIICNKNLIPGDDPKSALNPSGLRLGTQEITRLGFKKSDMKQVADLIRMAVIDGRESETVAREVEELTVQHRTIHYCFESAAEAYRYMKFY
jgi:glycine hydroxymethyltransferase